MELLLEVLRDELDTLHKEGVRIVPIGRLGDLPKPVRDQVDWAAQLTADNSKLKLNMAISYGGRLEIIEAIRELLAKAARGESVLATEETVAQHLYTTGDPDPDLIIRTGGERRLSNFLLWQSAYAELYFSDTMWPEFTSDDFLQALAEYQKRERRFGKIRKKASERE
jgi:undecaprenyl diphosphate synthase